MQETAGLQGSTGRTCPRGRSHPRTAIMDNDNLTASWPGRGKKRKKKKKLIHLGTH